MKKAKKENGNPLIFNIFKYFSLAYVLFLAILLRSQLFYFVAFIIVFVFLYFNRPARILSELKFILVSLTEKFMRIKRRQVFEVLKNYKFEALICFAYIIIMISFISWGLPSDNHPFPYYMDESHSLQAVKTVIRYGTSNLPHQEVGPMFNYIVSAVLVSPLFLFRIINPFAITTAISALVVQEQLYIALRAITLIFGFLALVVMVRVSRILKISSILCLCLFVITPVWLSISNYFKYDIALLFWIVLSLLLFLNYSKKPTRTNFMLAAISSGLAVSTKLTGLPLLFLLIFSFFYFTPHFRKQIRTLILGIIAYTLVFIFCGIPDIIFGGRSMMEYLYYNIFSNPQNDKTFIYGVSHFEYMLFQLLPAIFGHFFILLSTLSVVYFVYIIIKGFFEKRIRYIREYVFVLLGFTCFAASLTPLWIIAANRALVLLPFLTIIICIFLRDVYINSSQILRRFITFFLLVGLCVQAVESYAWVGIKYTSPPQAESSKWVLKNISKNELIGIENIPVYEMLPDIVIREFYEKQYKVKKKYNFKYEIIDYKTKKLPPVVILSNADFEYKNRSKSTKKKLVERLLREKYHEIAGFSPKLELYKFFTNDINFVMVGMTTVPKRISVYKKN